MTRVPARPAVFFASDYGTDDEFVGVVHAVLHRLAPEIPVIDLSHQILPFDVAGGADLLVRSAPFLGNGVVLAVVDPGVGTDRRGVALRTAGTPAHAVRPGYPGHPSAPAATADRPAWLVGPDNGLLMAAADLLGGVREAIWLHPEDDRWPGPPAVTGSGPTFDGRDVFAPATAHLAGGGDPTLLGPAVDPGSLEPAPSAPATAVVSRVEGGLDGIRAPVTSIDRFGNVQLALGPEVLGSLGLAVGDRAAVTAPMATSPGGAGRESAREAAAGRRVVARRVVAFDELAHGELGLLVDGSGRVALVLGRDSAATFLGLDRVTGIEITIVPEK